MVMVAGTKYGNAREQALQSGRSREPRPGGSERPAGPLLKVTNRHLVDVGEWFLRELREGGEMWLYFQRERERIRQQSLALKRRMRNWRQDPRADYEVLARIPFAAYYRWTQEDPHFFDDLSNLKRLKRDDETAVVFV
jgi:hypothetical protein